MAERYIGPNRRALASSDPVGDVELLLQRVRNDIGESDSLQDLEDVVALWVRLRLGKPDAKVHLSVPRRVTTVIDLTTAKGPDDHSGEDRSPTMSFPIRRGNHIVGSLDVTTDPQSVFAAWNFISLMATLASTATPFVSHTQAGTLGRAAGENRGGEAWDRGHLGLAWTAHEFKEPLTAVRAALEYMRDSDLGEAAAHDLLERSCQSVERLIETVDVILEWVRARRNAPNERFDLAAVAQWAAAPMIRRFGSRVTVDAPSPVEILGFRVLLEAALSNLIRNAAAYSPQDGRIGVSVSRDGAQAIVSIEDEGPGIPVHERKSIFEPLIRGTEGRRREGTGMGLFIARQAVESHGGRIWVESNGIGSTFRFVIPATEEVPLSAS